MGIVLCSKCSSVDGVLCANCGKPNHFSYETHRNGTGGHWTGSRWDDCWRVLRRAKARFKTCENHEAVLCECDVCRTREPAVPNPRWRRSPDDPPGWKRVTGVSGSQSMMLCPTCHGTFRVGLDWSMERNGESLSVSIACAFAFQLGQYEKEIRGQSTAWRGMPLAELMSAELDMDIPF